MLDLPGHPILDKQLLIGGCIRLSLRVDAARLRTEVDDLPAELWGSRGGRLGVHRAAEAIFLRGHAPAEGDLPIEDRPELARLPYARSFIQETVPAPPMRCLLARLPASGTIAPHRDQAPYFAKTIRIHVPVVSNAQSHMFCAGAVYRMREGEVWALNNLAIHAVWNAHGSAARTHLICDFLPTPALLGLLAVGERGLGRMDPALDQALRERIAVQAQTQAMTGA